MKASLLFLYTLEQQNSTGATTRAKHQFPSFLRVLATRASNFDLVQSRCKGRVIRTELLSMFLCKSLTTWKPRSIVAQRVLRGRPWRTSRGECLLFIRTGVRSTIAFLLIILMTNRKIYLNFVAVFLKFRLPSRAKLTSRGSIRCYLPQCKPGYC